MNIDIEGGLGVTLHGPRVPRDAGAVHQDVDAAEAPIGCGDQGLDLGALSDVGANEGEAVPRRGEFLEQALGALGIEVADHDAGGALAQKGLDAGPADAADSAGDDGDAVLKLDRPRWRIGWGHG